MSVASRIQEIETHIGDIYDTLEVGGTDLTGLNKNIVNINSSLKDRYKYFLNNGVEVIWNNWEKVIGEGTEFTLENTIQAPMKVNLKGNTYQKSTTGKNLFDGEMIQNARNNNDGKSIITSTKYIMNKNLVRVLPNTSYTFSATFTNDTTGGDIHYLDENGDFLSRDSLAKNGTKTTPNNCYFINFQYYNPTAISPSDVISIQIEQGSNATSYEEYTGCIPSPNPDYPQEIKNTTGEQVVKVAGKNLFKIPLENGSSNGITWVINENGSITLNGTSTNHININSQSINMPVVVGETYTISATNIPVGNIGFKELNGNDIWVLTSNTLHKTQTINNNIKTKDIMFAIYIPPNKTLDNVTITFQLEKGSTATEYEEYKEQSYEINLGKNLIFLKDVNNTANGLTGTISGNTITISGTNTKTDENWGLVGTGVNLGNSVFPNMLAGEKYTLSVDENVSGVYFQINYYKNGTSTQENLVKLNITSDKSITFTVPNDYTRVAQAFVGIARTATTIDTTFNIQLEKGSSASSFSPYFTPIELCETEDHQDDFIRNSGKNIFDKDTLIAEKDNFIRHGQYYIYYELPNEYKAKITVSISLIGTSQDLVLGFTNTKANVMEQNSRILNGRTLNSPKTFDFSNAETVYLGIGNGSQISSDKQEVVDILNNYNIQVELGEQSTEYEPYGTGKWYLHKEIGKVVLDGSENFTSAGTVGTDYRYNKTLSSLGFSLGLNSARYCIASHFISVYILNLRTWGVFYINGNWIVFYDKDKHFETATEFNNWLSTHNVTLYYVLATPTYTEITDTTLLNQLEAIYKAISHDDQTNISQVNNNMPFKLEVTALKNI